MKYYRGFISTPVEKFLPRVTEKAYCFTIAGGYTTANDYYTYFPKSQVKIGEPNEVGNAEILIPMWLIRNKGIDRRRIREIGTYNGEDDVVERQKGDNDDKSRIDRIHESVPCI